jgi:hypothetical protein
MTASSFFLKKERPPKKTCEDKKIRPESKIPFGLEELKFNSHHINVAVNT